MPINQVASSPSPSTVLTHFTQSAVAQRSPDPAPSVSRYTFPASIHPPVDSFNFKIDGESNTTTIADAGEVYTASLPGLGTVSGPSVASVDAAIIVRISELA